jgi:hypothetical protein
LTLCGATWLGTFHDDSFVAGGSGPGGTYGKAQVFVPDGYRCCVDAVGDRARLILQKAVQVLAADFQKDICQRKTLLSTLRAELEEEAVRRGADRVEEIPRCTSLASFGAHGEGDPGGPLT